MIRPQRVDNGKLNTCILKASVDTVNCWTQYCVRHSTRLGPLSLRHLSSFFTISSVKYTFQISEMSDFGLF